jgi:hypothetical protein
VSGEATTSSAGVAGTGVAPASRRASWAIVLGVFLLALAGFLAIYLRYPAIQDTDSYYHLALAREAALRGLPDRLEWARFTPLAEAFGDPVLGFHLLLAPFAGSAQPERAALFALAAFGAAIFAALAAFAVAAVGRGGAWFPWIVLLGSTEALFRLVRLRPELLALLLLLAAAWLIGRGSPRLLGLLAVVYALSYSAVQAFAGLVLGSFVVFAWRGRWPWRLPVYALGGLALGLVLHPQFPANLMFLTAGFHPGLVGQAAADTGRELGPHSTAVAVFTQLGIWVAALVTWLARRPLEGAVVTECDAATRDTLVVFAAAFLVLYATSARFVVFALPFAGLALLWHLRASAMGIGPRFPWFGRRLPTAAGYGLAALLAAGPLALQGPRFVARASTGPDDLRLTDRRAAAALLPAGARVAATWGTADLFAFYAPQARYLEVLDPGPMARYAPVANAAKLRVFSGTDPDPAFTIASVLESDYLLASRFGEPGVEVLERQLRADPRVEVLHAGISLLARVVPGRNSGFVLDWGVAAEDPRAWQAMAPPLPPAALVAYPRPTDPHLRAVEGYVDVGRLGAGPPCVVHVTTLSPATVADGWRFASSGPAELWWNGALLVRTENRGPARLDEAIAGVAPVSPAGAPVTLAVRSCRDETERRPATSETPPQGFFLELLTATGDRAPDAPSPPSP